MARASAYYQPIYADYMRRGVPTLRLNRMIRRVVLHDLGEVRAIAEALSDGLYGRAGSWAVPAVARGRSPAGQPFVRL